MYGTNLFFFGLVLIALSVALFLATFFCWKKHNRAVNEWQIERFGRTCVKLAMSQTPRKITWFHRKEAVS